MNSSRMEAFSDGVLAIVITIQVLAMKVPVGDSLSDFISIFPSFASYITSFLYVAIYWNNHHHLLKNVKFINGKILWANIHFLFWISLLPFAADWMNAHKMSKYPVALYTVILLLTAIAYYVLQKMICENDDKGILERELGRDLKTKLSILAYIISVVLAFTNPIVSRIVTFLLALVWFVPDKRTEKAFEISSEE